MAHSKMTPETAELAIADPAGELPGALHGPRRRDPRALLAWRPLATLRALWSSRLLIWVAAAATLSTYGFGPVRHAFNPPGLTRGFGWLGDVLAAPAARWDASWYLVIAHYGYRPDLGSFTASREPSG
jgi:hypothetical protein